MFYRLWNWQTGLSQLSLGMYVCLVVTVPVSATELMLPQVYSMQVEVNGWLMSEKLDGVRGYWDGQQLLSKNRNRLFPPEEFTCGLPPFPVEGELWGGRGRFEATLSIVRQQQPHTGWRQLRFAIFDVPQASGGFTTRIELVRDWFTRHPSTYALVVECHDIVDTF